MAYSNEAIEDNLMKKLYRGVGRGKRKLEM